MRAIDYIECARVRFKLMWMPSNSGSKRHRRPRESGDPVTFAKRRTIPALAGKTVKGRWLIFHITLSRTQCAPQYLRKLQIVHTLCQCA